LLGTEALNGYVEVELKVKKGLLVFPSFPRRGSRGGTK